MRRSRSRVGLIAILLAAPGAAFAAEESPVVVYPKLHRPAEGYNDCYPIGSAMRGREGRIAVSFTVLPDGSTSALQFPDGTPTWLKETSACIVRKIRFTAGTQDGVPVEMPATLPINLGIAGSDGEPAPKLDGPVLRSSEETIEAAYRQCYPADLSREATVNYRVDIGVDGRARAPKVVTSSGDERLDKAGICVLGLLRFKPMQRGSQAVRSTVVMPFLVRPANQGAR